MQPQRSDDMRAGCSMSSRSNIPKDDPSLAIPARGARPLSSECDSPSPLFEPDADLCVGSEGNEFAHRCSPALKPFDSSTALPDCSNWRHRSFNIRISPATSKPLPRSTRNQQRSRNSGVLIRTGIHHWLREERAALSSRHSVVEWHSGRTQSTSTLEPSLASPNQRTIGFMPCFSITRAERQFPASQ